MEGVVSDRTSRSLRRYASVATWPVRLVRNWVKIEGIRVAPVLPLQRAVVETTNILRIMTPSARTVGTFVNVLEQGKHTQSPKPRQEPEAAPVTCYNIQQI